MCLRQVGDFFMSNSQFDKAVHLFITSKQPEQAMDLCEKHGVKMTESMAERLTELLPEKEVRVCQPPAFHVTLALPS
jgi:hypothetical protein